MRLVAKARLTVSSYVANVAAEGVLAAIALAERQMRASKYRHLTEPPTRKARPVRARVR